MAGSTSGSTHHFHLKSAAWTAAGCLVVLAAAAVVGLSWRNDLPNPVAIHWSAGAADGFVSPSMAVLLILGIGGLVALLLCCVGAFWAGSAMNSRFWLGLAAGLTTIVTIVGLGMLAEQRGLANARNAPNGDTLTLIAVVVGVLVGAGVAALMPDDSPTS